MTDMKQPEALRLIAEWRNSMPIGVMRIWAADVRDELRRQHAEIESLRAKMDELARQEPLAFVLQSTADGSIFKSVVAMVGWSSFKRDLNALETDPWVKAGRAKIIPLYLAAGARPVEPAPADGWLHSSGMLYRLTDERRPKNRDEINVTMADGSRSLESRSRRAGELLDCIRAMQAAQEPFGYVNTNTGQFFAYVESCRKNNEGHWRTVYTVPQPAPAAQDDAKDAARWRYAVAIGENQAMNWLDVYNDWDGEGSFVDAIDAALEASKKEPTNGN